MECADLLALLKAASNRRTPNLSPASHNASGPDQLCTVPRRESDTSPCSQALRPHRSLNRCFPTTRVRSTCRSGCARQILWRSDDLVQRETCAKGSLASNTPAEKRNG